MVDEPNAMLESVRQMESRLQALVRVWIQEDDMRFSTLKLVQACARVHAMPQWCVAAGFVRNLVWERLHGQAAKPLNDIDVIYYCPLDIRPERDLAIEQYLLTLAPELPWSVKNQARMHLHNQDNPYQDVCDAMSYWPEIETAVAVTLPVTWIEATASAEIPSNYLQSQHTHTERNFSQQPTFKNGQSNGIHLNHADDLVLNVIAPFGLMSLFSLKITPNPRRDLRIFQARLASKTWLDIYPKLRIADI